MTIDINKGIICDLLQCKSLSQVEGAILKKMTEENQILDSRNKDLREQLDEVNAKFLLVQ